MKLFTITISILLLACQTKENEQNATDSKQNANATDSKQNTTVFDVNDEFEVPRERDSLLLLEWVHPRIKQCLRDPEIVVITRTFLADTSRFITLKNLGDINGDRVNDSIMVIPELYKTDSSADAGTAIIFSDPSIPRIRVDQVCLDVSFVFPVADINEDGRLELGKYFTSCVSRFKGLDLLSMRGTQWTIVGSVGFDVFFENPPMEKRIRKITKGKFKMREVTDSAGVKIDRWTQFEMK